MISNLTSIFRSDTPKIARAYIIPIESGTDEVLNRALRAFQYFPESVKDNKATNWQPKDIPGLSHPLYQWTSSGPREIGFTVVFSRDNALAPNEKGDTPPQASTTDPRNVHIPDAIAWLRSFKYPTKRSVGSAGNTGRTNSVAGKMSMMKGMMSGQKDGSFFPLPPRKLVLGIPGLGLNYGQSNTGFNKDEVPCIMLQCEVNYESFFNDGTPRFATVQLNFAEIIQFQGQVNNQYASSLHSAADRGYWLTDIGVPRGTAYTPKK